MADKPLLLHACCGPCSLEPVRVLREQGFLPTIVYANSNIQPYEEYCRRLETLRAWAAQERLEVVEGPYEPGRWEREVGRYGTNRLARCRACYRMRLAGAASLAGRLGLPAMSTTLAVSPYQLFDACGQELGRACAQAGLGVVWQDFRPLYPKATARAKELGLYRQNYCGCRFSAAEAALERCQARDARTLQRDVGRACDLVGRPGGADSRQPADSAPSTR